MALHDETLTQKLQHYAGDLSVQRLVDFCERAQCDHSEELTTSQTNKLALGVMAAMADAAGQPLHWPRARHSQKYPVVYKILRSAMEWLTGRRVIFEGIPKAKQILIDVQKLQPSTSPTTQRPSSPHTQHRSRTPRRRPEAITPPSIKSSLTSPHSASDSQQHSSQPTGALRIQSARPLRQQRARESQRSRTPRKPPPRRSPSQPFKRRRTLSISSSPELRSEWAKRHKYSKGTKSEQQSRHQPVHQSALAQNLVQENQTAPQHIATDKDSTSPNKIKHSDHVCISVLSATANSIIIGNLVRVTGGSQQAASQLESYAMQQSDVVQQAQILGLAFIVEQQLDCQQYVDYVHTSGNMVKLYQNNIQALGRFLARHPQATEAIPCWTMAGLQEAENPDLLPLCAELMATTQFPIQVDFLRQALGQPTKQAELVSSIITLAGKNTLPRSNHQRLLILAAALSTSEEPEHVLRQLKAHDMNPYLALPSQQFGKVLESGYVDLSLLQDWVGTHPRAQGIDMAATSRTRTAPASYDWVESHAAANRPQQSQPQSVRLHRIPQKLLLSAYQDLRLLQPVLDPEQQEALYASKAAAPASPPGTAILRYEAPSMTDPRARRWQWWQHVSQVGYYVREHYMFTKWEGRINCSAAGNEGQVVIRAASGTFTWLPADKRIMISNSSSGIQARLEVICSPWRPEADMVRRYHRGKLPNQIQSFLADSTTPMTPQSRPGFQ